MAGLEWSQISVGAILGAVGQWALGLTKAGFEHFLEGRRQKAADERVIRAEEREQARKKAEKDEVVLAQIAKDESLLLLHRTRMCGAADLGHVIATVESIHEFFRLRPQYIGVANNRAFLEKYPQNFSERFFDPQSNFNDSDLASVKKDADSLRVR
jgi:hypothetical protein